MPKAASPKKNFLFTEEDEIPEALLAQRPGQPEPEEPAPTEPAPSPVPDEDDEEENTEENTEEDTRQLPADAGNAEANPHHIHEHSHDGDTHTHEHEHDDAHQHQHGQASQPSQTGLTMGLNGEILPNQLRYESRITIVDAWQYPGSLRDAPNWVDRNWAAYSDFDPVRAIEPGPCLRIPMLTGETAVARIGDYVVTQEVRYDEFSSDLRIEVWPQTQFEKLFMPKPKIWHSHDPHPYPEQPRTPTDAVTSQ